VASCFGAAEEAGGAVSCCVVAVLADVDGDGGGLDVVERFRCKRPPTPFSISLSRFRLLGDLPEAFPFPFFAATFRRGSPASLAGATATKIDSERQAAPRTRPSLLSRAHDVEHVVIRSES